MKKIQLNNSRKTKNYRKYFALVDDEDFELVSQYKWSISSYGYAECRDSEHKILGMHRLIIPTKSGMKIDHINMNPLDNRRENLRICTHRQNLWNRIKPTNNTSGFKGVSWEKRRNKWRASICKNYKQFSLGEFFTKNEAALAYNRKARELFGNFARLNTI